MKKVVRKIPDWVRITAPSPLLTRLMLFSTARPAYSYLNAEQLNIIGLVAAQENACRFCYGLQRALMRMTGYSEERIRAIERDLEVADEKTRAVANFCRRLAQSNPRPARAEREALERSGFTREAVAEVAFEVAVNCFTNRVASFLAISPQESLEKMPDQWWSFLLRPAVAWKTRPKRVKPVNETATGPLAPILEALNGTAAPPIFRGMVDHVFSPSALPHRSKLLIFATVARGLQCPFCEEMATSRLTEESLSRAEVGDILDALDSPRLTDLEARLLPFARATIRYESYQMQERTAQLAREVGPEQALEAVGVTSMANMTVRLAMLLA